ncbi:imidazole glycerol phosphate synthase subunit HisH [Hyphomicrobium sp.]|uniref:imidazole glycerol phosphate synthase subunit HisH n=1 Tax=Hyphomicrobium sp. TaxID=82 RepID=UPI0025BFD84F|nr:imidazole glycerol phosphate synthase subunit HisH [Hyphomicrobium sp.]MCC7250960.1 imidazole glycerol phosphate synthase subunit HisH [Hyphomicrobium sp.]
MNVTIVDYGAGNLRSVYQAFFLAGADPVTSNDPDVVRRAERVVLPGVGAAGAALEALRARDLDAALDDVRHVGRPILGICLGLQMMADEVQEFGTHRGLGWMRGKVARIPSDGNIRVPHMGWSPVDVTERGHDLIGSSAKDRNFYFCHSNRLYADRDVAAATVAYGEPFTVAVQFESIFAVQFHPEKSQLAGQRFIKRFLDWAP